MKRGRKMVKDTFKTVAATPGNSNWEKLTERRASLYSREDDVRSPFARIIHESYIPWHIDV